MHFLFLPGVWYFYYFVTEYKIYPLSPKFNRFFFQVKKKLGKKKPSSGRVRCPTV